MTAAPDVPIRGPVWLLHGLTRSEPAMLEMAQGRLSCHTDRGLAFDVRVDRIEALVFPWYYFGGGMKLTVAGVPHRISFVQPNDAIADLPSRLAARDGNVAGLALAGQKLRDIGDGRGAGRIWRSALESARQR